MQLVKTNDKVYFKVVLRGQTDIKDNTYARGFEIGTTEQQALEWFKKTYSWTIVKSITPCTETEYRKIEFGNLYKGDLDKRGEIIK